MFKPPRHSGTAFVTALLIVVVVAFSSLLGGTGPSDLIARSYEIPPTFNGMRILYGMTIAFILPMSLFSAGAILENARFLASFEGRWHEPVKVHTVNETLVLVTIFCGVAPDAVVMLAWGESAAPTSGVLSALDRVFDIIAAMTFIGYLVRRIRSRPVILFALQRQPLRLEMMPTWEQLKPKIRVGIVVIILSFGVAFAK